MKILWPSSPLAGISSSFSVNVANILCTKCFNVGNIFLMIIIKKMLQRKSFNDRVFAPQVNVNQMTFFWP